MAEEIRVSSQGPDGNGVQVDLREKKFALTGPNVALLLLILIVGWVAWDRTGKVDNTLKAGQEQLAATEDRVHKRVSELFGRMDKMLDDQQTQNVLLTTNNTKITEGQHTLQQVVTAEIQRRSDKIEAAMHEQDERLRAQTAAIDSKFATLTQYVEGWFSEMGRRQELMNHNVLNPDNALPLRAPVPEEERQRERGR